MAMRAGQANAGGISCRLADTGGTARDDALVDWRRDTAAWTAIGAAMTIAIALLTVFVVRQHARREEDQARLTAASRRSDGTSALAV